MTQKKQQTPVCKKKNKFCKHILEKCYFPIMEEISDIKEHKLRVFANRALRRIPGPKRNEVTGGWRKLYNEYFHNLYSSPSTIRMIKSRRIRQAGHIACMGENNVYRILVGRPEGKRPLK
jgi:hypothetical protein